VKRRDFFGALGLAAVELEAQETPGSLYIPKPHLVEDRKFLHDFMDEFSFVDLVTASPTIRITHIPSVLDRGAGKYGTIRGHVARNNPQSQVFDGKQTAVIVFRGPHSYISPTWYSKPEAVPTWNFGVVHATGRPRAITDPKAVHALLAGLIHKHEGSGGAYDFSKLPDSYVYGMIGGVVGFELEIELLEGKFKLGQERSADDRAGILRGLAAAKPERSIHDFTAAFYERKV